MRTILYKDLDKHFIAPKKLNVKPFFSYKKFPRKLKKELKKVPHCDNLNQAMWCVMEENYKRFIIKKLCELYGANN